MSKKTKITVCLAIALLLVGIVLFPMLKKQYSNQTLPEPAPASQKTGQPAKNALNVRAMVIKPTHLTDFFKTKGLLIPNEEVNLTFETSGKITQIHFKEGSAVKKGQLLAKINDQPLQAELKKFLAQLPLAEERVFRQKSLLAKDAVSQESMESVNTELEKLKADIEFVRARIAQTELRAPFDGIVGLRLVSEGAYTTPSTVVSRLTNLSPLKIEFSVNERQATQIRAGVPLTFRVENDLTHYNATVYAVESRLDAQTLSLKARALYPNPNGRLKPGHSATIEIKLEEIKNTIAIPSIASITEMGRDIAYILKNGVAHQVVLQKGLRTASSVQIVDGLQVGDTLLVTGVMQLRESMPIRIEAFDEEL